MPVKYEERTTLTVRLKYWDGLPNKNVASLPPEVLKSSLDEHLSRRTEIVLSGGNVGVRGGAALSPTP